MIDRQKVVQWLYDVVNGNCRKDDSEMAKQAIDLILAPPADLTPYLAAAATMLLDMGCGRRDPHEIVLMARSLRDASKEA